MHQISVNANRYFLVDSINVKHSDWVDTLECEQIGDGNVVEGYRWGFNSQEKVDEIAGSGNHNTALFWEYDTRTGRRWNLDPKPTIGISDYACFGGNPILNVDLMGDLKDWYKNKESGDIKWFAKEGEQGKTETIKGEEWTNLGSELLKFEGNKLTYFWQTKDDKGNLKVNNETWNAVAGKPIENNDGSRTFDYSKKSQNTENGPIPEGLWSLQKSKVQYWDNQSNFDKVKNYFGGGLFPSMPNGGLFGWGENRWWLNPLQVNTERKNLTGFTIHGGAIWGSHGCIDLTHNLGSFTSTFLHVAKSENVVLWVDYSKITTITVKKDQWGW